MITRRRDHRFEYVRSWALEWLMDNAPAQSAVLWAQIKAATTPERKAAMCRHRDAVAIRWVRSLESGRLYLAEGLRRRDQLDKLYAGQE